MDSLYQRLRELDPDTFQRLCAQLLTERHPSADIRHVEGASGDEGLDIFTGSLEYPIIWQCKAFAHGVGNSQKEQIRKSLRKALSKFTPKKWVLCISVDFDAKSQRWFERLAKSYESKVEIGLFPATAIVHELLHRRALRNQFFPGAGLDVTELKKLLGRTNDLTFGELEAITETNLEDYVERLKERDARFNYEIVFGGERGPQVLEERPGLMLTISNGNRAINVFARDIRALEEDPPTLSAEVQGSGIPKLLSLIKTGAQQEFNSSEIANFKTNWDLLRPALSDYKFVVGPSKALHKRRLRVRMTFTNQASIENGKSVDFGFVELAGVRAGTEEVEMESVTTHLPFKIRLTIPLNTASDCPRTAQITFQRNFVGHDVRDIQQFLHALQILRNNGEIVLFDLERNKQILQGKPDQLEEFNGEKGILRFIDMLVRFEEIFGVTLKLPENISQSDENSFLLLKRYVEREGLNATDFSFAIPKTETNSEMVVSFLKDPQSIRIAHETLLPKPRLFGTEIDTGPCAMTIKTSTVKNLDETLCAFENTNIGDSVRISLTPTSPITHELLDRSVDERD